MSVLKNFNEDELKFIRENLQEDPLELSLKFHGTPGKKVLIEQITARQKLRKKLPEWVGNEQIRFPAGLPLEQASSELTARLKAQLISGQSLTDITGGLSVDCYYLRQSFNKATYVDRQEILAEHARYNFRVLGTDIEVKQGDAEAEILHNDSDVIYLDPHRRGKGNSKQIMLADHEPNVLDFLPDLVKDERKSLIKTSPMLDISMALQELKHVSEVWVISLANDCKEVVYLLEAGVDSSPRIRTWNRSGNSWQYFEGLRQEAFRPELSEPLDYLYEPNASVFKAGLHDEVAKEFKLEKLNLNSHLYTGTQLLSSYPGRVFKIEKTMRAWDKQLKGGRYNVISRNFRENAAVIEKRLKLKPAAEDFIIASTLPGNHAVFIVVKLLPVTE